MRILSPNPKWKMWQAEWLAQGHIGSKYQNSDSDLNIFLQVQSSLHWTTMKHSAKAERFQMILKFITWLLFLALWFFFKFVFDTKLSTRNLAFCQMISYKMSLRRNYLNRYLFNKNRLFAVLTKLSFLTCHPLIRNHINSLLEVLYYYYLHQYLTVILKLYKRRQSKTLLPC